MTTIDEIKNHLGGNHTEYFVRPALDKSAIPLLAELAIGSDSIFARRSIVFASKTPCAESLAIAEFGTRNVKRNIRATSAFSLIGYT